MQDERQLICTGFFKKESNMDAFIGLSVRLSTGEEGYITGPFGKSGKFKVVVGDGVQPETAAQIRATSKGRGKGKAKAKANATANGGANKSGGGDGGGGGKGGPNADGAEVVEAQRAVGVTLTFKKLVFDKSATMVQ